MNFIFCGERKGQRIAEAVCEANVKKGTCTQDLLKCRKAKTPKATTFKKDFDDSTPSLKVDHHDHLYLVEPDSVQFNLFPERKD